MTALEPKRSRCRNCGCFYYRWTHRPFGLTEGLTPNRESSAAAAAVKGGCTNCGRIDVENLESPVGDAVWSSNREIWMRKKCQAAEAELLASSSSASTSSPATPPSCASKPGGGSVSGSLSVAQRIMAAEWIREMDQLFDAHSDAIIEHSEGEPFNTLWLDCDKSAAPIPERPIPLTTLLPVWKKKIDRETAEERGEVNMDEAPSHSPSCA